MKVLVTGAGGFLGRALVDRLLQPGALAGADGEAVDVSELVALDRAGWPAPADPRVRQVVANIVDPGVLQGLIDGDTGAVFHLAAVVSGEAESDFDLGMAVNLDASWELLECCRRVGRCPRVIFTSSVAVYGGPLPDVVGDHTALTPRSSYGVEKAIAELLLEEYSRRGLVDGIALRLPTVSVRPGRPNKAASSFASGIVREPIAGEVALCPVPADTRLWLMSPRRAVEALVRAQGIGAESLGERRAVNLPGLSITVAEMLDALERVAGREVRKRVVFEPDPLVQRIVGGWPGSWNQSRALVLGFSAELSFDDIVRDHMVAVAAQGVAH